MTVRRAEPADAPAVARLLDDFNREFDYPTPGVELLTERGRRLLATGEITVLLAGEGPDGLAVVRYRPSLYTGALDAYLEELYVVPARRGQGLGRALLEAVMDLARAAGAEHIELVTAEDDTVARALYSRCGFRNREEGADGAQLLYYEREL